MKTLLFLLLALKVCASPVVKEIKWGEVCGVISTWKAVNPSGTSAWATSESMLPGIRVGDLLLAEAYVGQPLVGEVAVFDMGPFCNVSHEVLKVTKFKFLSKGTNNKHVDGWQDKHGVKYVLIAVLRPSY